MIQEHKMLVRLRMVSGCRVRGRVRPEREESKKKNLVNQQQNNKTTKNIKTQSAQRTSTSMVTVDVLMSLLYTANMERRVLPSSTFPKCKSPSAGRPSKVGTLQIPKTSTIACWSDSDGSPIKEKKEKGEKKKGVCSTCWRNIDVSMCQY